MSSDKASLGWNMGGGGSHICQLTSLHLSLLLLLSWLLLQYLSAFDPPEDDWLQSIQLSSAALLIHRAALAVLLALACCTATTPLYRYAAYLDPILLCYCALHSIPSVSCLLTQGQVSEDNPVVCIVLAGTVLTLVVLDLTVVWEGVVWVAGKYWEGRVQYRQLGVLNRVVI